MTQPEHPDPCTRPEPQPHVPDPTRESSGPEPPTRPLIAIIDNDRSTCVVLRLILEAAHLDADILAFTHPFEALKVLLEPGGRRPVLAYIDINLREMLGYTLLQDLKKRIPELTIVVVTWSPSIEVRLKSHLAGARHHLVKPFEAQTITRIARYTLAAHAQKQASSSEQP